jgi:hypothetical protein
MSARRSPERLGCRTGSFQYPHVRLSVDQDLGIRLDVPETRFRASFRVADNRSTIA